jgi:hypothetical protein
MKYGTMAIAKKYASEQKQQEWLQLFLRNDGHNLAFAEGLLLEKRYYIGPIKVLLELLNFPTDIPDYLTATNDIQYFLNVVERMKESYVNQWDVPPLIVNYDSGIFEVNDGRHRFVMYHQLGIKETEVLFWITNEADYNELLGILDVNR